MSLTSKLQRVEVAAAAASCTSCYLAQLKNNELRVTRSKLTKLAFHQFVRTL